MSLRVTPVLGIISVESGGELDASAKPAKNSTRWMFDVEGVWGEPLVLQLIEGRTKKKLSPELVACSFLARSAAFYDAKPFLAGQNGGLITIRHGGFIPAATAEEAQVHGVKGIPCTYRVMIDVLHTATR